MGVEDQPTRFVVDSIAHEQYKFGTQMEEYAQQLIVSQVEAARGIVE